MLKFIKDVDQSTKFNVEVFGGAVIFEVRSLSPIEAEVAGISSSLVAKSMMNPKQVAKMMRQKDKLNSINLEDPTDEDLETILNIMEGFQPESLLTIEEQQNKLICSVVRRASEDGGKTFEDLHLVTGYDQQDPAHNRLWIGMLTKEDRNKILDKAMNSHVEAVELLNNFRKTG